MNDMVLFTPEVDQPLSCQELIDAEARKVNDLLNEFARHRERFDAVLFLLRREKFLRIEISLSGLDICQTGTRGDLVETARILHRCGFRPTSRPGPDDTTYSAFWNHDLGGQIWFSFTSNQCRRVKVGEVTKTVTEAVYEVVCDEALTDGN